MLTTLRISGLAVVEEAEVRLGPGLNVLTGETGAGKSILVNALHLALGGRMSAEMLRDGAGEAVVEALFELPSAHPVFARLEEAGVPRPEAPPGEPAELLVRRVAPRGARGRAFVNGALCTVGMLEEALRGLVDVSGQHEHVSLLRPETHLDLLDGFAGLGGEGGLAARYREGFAALAALERERRELEGDEGERARRADYLGFQLRELESLDPRPRELEELEQERRVLAAGARLAEAARAAEARAYAEEGSASEKIGLAVRALAEAAEVDPRLAEPLGLLRSAAVEVEEAGRALGRYAGSLGGDPDRLAAVEDRLAGLRAVARKHGGSLEAALARREGMREELARLEGRDGRLAALAEEIASRAAAAAALAAQLTAARAEAAGSFARSVQRELEALAMARCRVDFAFEPEPGGTEAAGRRLGPRGAERGEILIAVNPGEPPRPLARAASGGELSRVLLAVKRAFSRVDPVPTYVFDEVDSGVGGAVAEAVGRALAAVAEERQVVCITHLPQVAAFAGRHLRVEKRVLAGRTRASVVPLEEPEERRREVARMLAGADVTDSALEHAASLIAAARAPGRGGRGAPRTAAREARAR